MKVKKLMDDIKLYEIDLMDLFTSLHNSHPKYRKISLNEDYKENILNDLRKDERHSIKLLLKEYDKLKDELDTLLNKDINFIQSSKNEN